jgi:DNA (cytosine-5)-methyltransferase 1
VTDDAFTFIDLFAGIGGFHAALSGLGGRCVYVAEKDPAARRVYQAAWLDKELDKEPTVDINDDVPLDTGHTVSELVERAERGEIKLTNIPKDFDVLAAGFPCQAFSKSGKQEGVLDQVRGTLFYNILVIVAIRRPKIIFLENVKNLVGPAHKKTTYRTIIETLTKQLGYVVNPDPTIFSPHFLSPEMGGGPQSRERVYILAVRKDLVTGSGNPFTGPVRSPGWSPDEWRLTETRLSERDAPAVITDEWVESALKDPQLSARAKEVSRLLGDVEQYRLTEGDEWFRTYETLVQKVSASTRHKPNARGSRFPGHPIWFNVKDQVWAAQERADARAYDVPGAKARPWKVEFLDKSSRFVIDYADVLDEPSGVPLIDQITKLKNKAWRKFEWQAQDAKSLSECLIQVRPSGIRVKKATYTPALVAINQAPILGKDKRRLTPYEAGRVQGFPDHVFEAMQRVGQPDGQSYKQFGNAVHVGTVQYALVRFMKHHFGDAELDGDTGLGVLLKHCRAHRAWRIDERAAASATVAEDQSPLTLARAIADDHLDVDPRLAMLI